MFFSLPVCIMSSGTNIRRQVIMWKFNPSGCLTTLRHNCPVESLAYSEFSTWYIHIFEKAWSMSVCNYMYLKKITKIFTSKNHDFNVCFHCQLQRFLCLYSVVEAMGMLRNGSDFKRVTSFIGEDMCKSLNKSIYIYRHWCKWLHQCSN